MALHREYRANNLDRIRVRERKSKRRKRLDIQQRARERAQRVAMRLLRLDETRARERLYAARNGGWVNALKSKPCSDCQRAFLPCCMDFDHDPSRGVKVKGIGQLMAGSRVKLEAEISKCDLVCACCHRLRTRARSLKHVVRPSRERFYERIDALKGEPCSGCGLAYPPRAMDFDHVSGTKVATIAQLRGEPWDVVALELSKCELVCANCHRMRTWKRRELLEVA